MSKNNLYEFFKQVETTMKTDLSTQGLSSMWDVWYGAE